MKPIVFLATAICFICSGAYAQQSGAYNGTTNYYPTYNYLDRYPTNYYSPVLWGPNGFRTVNEENILMDQTLEAMRRQRDKDNASPEEQEQAKSKHDEEVAARKRAAEAKNKHAAKVKR